jgi:hypothetical protein
MVLRAHRQRLYSRLLAFVAGTPCTRARKTARVLWADQALAGFRKGSTKSLRAGGPWGFDVRRRRA